MPQDTSRPLLAVKKKKLILVQSCRKISIVIVTVSPRIEGNLHLIQGVVGKIIIILPAIS